MRQYKLSKTLRQFKTRLAQYPPGALRDAKRALENIEVKHGLLFDTDFDATDAAEKELLIAQYQEMDATDEEIKAMLARWFL
jgi:hypothetical protein